MNDITYQPYNETRKTIANRLSDLKKSLRDVDIKKSNIKTSGYATAKSFKNKMELRSFNKPKNNSNRNQGKLDFKKPKTSINTNLPKIKNNKVKMKKSKRDIEKEGSYTNIALKKAQNFTIKEKQTNTDRKTYNKRSMNVERELFEKYKKNIMKEDKVVVRNSKQNVIIPTTKLQSNAFLDRSQTSNQFQGYNVNYSMPIKNGEKKKINNAVRMQRRKMDRYAADIQKRARSNMKALKRSMRVMDRSMNQKKRDFTSVKPLKIPMEINKDHQHTMDKLQKRFQTGSLVGQGAFSCIYKAYDKENDLNVILKITKSKKNELEKEFNMINALNHDNIIKVYDIIEEKKSPNAVLVMEFGGNKNLKEYQMIQPNKSIPEDLAIDIISKLIDALVHMHDNRIAHSDLKMENISINLKSSYLIKLVDFGFADKYEGEKVDDFLCGTTGYMSPQLLAGRAYSPFKSDVWALGVLIYKMLFYMFPFKGKTEAEVLNKVKLKRLNFPSNIKVSSGIKKFIGSLLVFDETNRPTMEEARLVFKSIIMRE